MSRNRPVIHAFITPYMYVATFSFFAGLLYLIFSAKFSFASILMLLAPGIIIGSILGLLLVRFMRKVDREDHFEHVSDVLITSKKFDRSLLMETADEYGTNFAKHILGKIKSNPGKIDMSRFKAIADGLLEAHKDYDRLLQFVDQAIVEIEPLITPLTQAEANATETNRCNPQKNNTPKQDNE